MTPEQRNKLLGLVFGYSALSACALFLPFLAVAETPMQAAVYSAFSFVILFVVIRWALFRVGRRYD